MVATGSNRVATAATGTRSVAATPTPRSPQQRALRHLAVAAATLALLAAVPYAVPALARYRVWVPGDPVPFASLFRVEGTRRAGDPGIAAPVGAPVDDDLVRARLAEELGAAVAANLDVEVPAQPASPEPAVVTAPPPDPQRTGEAPPGSSEQVPPPPKVEVRIDPRELEGLAEPIEDPSGVALDGFYARLLRTARREPGAITRVAHYGDSTIATDGITATVRRRLQQRFGDAGHGFVLAARGYLPYRHEDVLHEASGWKVSTITRGGRKDGRYGYGGVLARGWRGARIRIGTVAGGVVGAAASLLEIAYQRHPRGGRLEIRTDGGAPQILDTRSAEGVEDAWERIEVPDGAHTWTLRVAGGGEVRLYGLVLERPGPGVVYDSLGIVGARASRLLNATPDHWARMLRHREPDLLVLQFGGNESVDRHMNMTWYHRRLGEVVRTMRAAAGPEVSCLLVAPLDQGYRDERGRVRTVPLVPRIVEVQRKVAAEQGCAFWSTFDAMGGRGAMARWYRARPRLAWGDFVHATPRGYEVLGNMLYKALLKGFADYLARP